MDITHQPTRMLSSKQKIEIYGSLEEYYKRYINYIIGTSGLYNSTWWTNSRNSSSSNTWRKKMYYDLYHGIYNKEKYKHITEPLGIDGDFPINIENYNIVKPVIDTLVGDKITRSYGFDVFSINPDAINMKIEMEMNYKYKIAMKEFFDSLGELGIEIPQDYTNIDEEYQQFLQTGKKTGIEKLANDIVRYLIYKTDFKSKITDGFKDFLISDSEIYKIDVTENDIELRICNPLHVYTNVSFSSPFIDDCDEVCEVMFMTVSEILDSFGESMEGEAMEALRVLSMWEQRSWTSITGYSNTVPQLYETLGFQNTGTSMLRKIPVYIAEWKDRYPVYFDEETGKVLVDDEIPSSYYDTDKEIKWINEAMTGARIGNNGKLFVNIKRNRCQFRDTTNSAKCELSYTGIVSTNRLYINNSLVSDLEPYQTLYNILSYKVNEAISLSGAKGIIVDVSQMPRTWSENGGDAISKFLYHLKTTGLTFIDSTVTSPETGVSSSFNQFKDYDLTISSSVQVFISLMEMIVMRVESLTGVNKPRQGQTAASDTATAVTSNVQQSAIITEHRFYKHAQAEHRLIKKMLNASKEIYKDGGYLSFHIGDAEIKQLSILPNELDFQDFDIYIDDDYKSKKIKAKCEELMAFAIQSNQMFMQDVIDVLSQDSPTQMKIKLEKATKRFMEIQQQSAQQNAQIEQMKMQQDSQLKQSQIQVDSENNIRDNNTKIQIVQMQLENSLHVNANTIISEKEKEQKEKESAVVEKVNKKEDEIYDKIQDDGNKEPSKSKNDSIK